MAREQHASMVVVEVPQDSTGSVLVVEFKAAGVASDLSAATGAKLYNAKTVDGAAVVTDGVAAWYTDGSDGKVSITMTTGLVGTPRDLYMDVEVQGYSGGNLVSYVFILRTMPRAKGV